LIFDEFAKKAQLLALQSSMTGEERAWVAGFLAHPNFQKLLGKVLIQRAGVASELSGWPLWGEENLGKALRLQGKSQGLYEAVLTIFEATREEEQDVSPDDDDRDA
jgi:hypothetical protein